VKYPEETLRRLLESQLVFYIVLERDGEVVYLSPEGRTFFDISPSVKVQGSNISNIIPAKIRDMLTETGETVFDSGKEVRKEFSALFMGKELWLEITASPVAACRDGKEIVGITGRDVTVCRMAEEKFEASEVRINKILGGSPVPIFVIDKNHNVIYWNRAIENYSGIKASEVAGTGLHYKAFYDHKRPCLADLLVDGEMEGIEEWYGGKYRESAVIDGAYEAEDFFPDIGDGGKWLHFTASVVRDEKGSIIGAVETLEDITNQKNAERVIIESRNKYQGYIENSPNAFFIVDEKGKFLEVNPAACSLLGYTDDEFLKMSITDIVPPEDVERVIKQFGGYLETKVFKEEIRLMTKKGEILNVILKAATLPDGKYLGFTTDITRLKKTSRELIEKEKIFRLLFETMSEGVAIHDIIFEGNRVVDYKITDVNDAFSRILGISVEDAVGSLASELYGTDSPPYLDIYSQVALSGTPQNFEVHFAPLDKYFEISVMSPKKGSFATIFTDISERKRSEIILKESEEKFREVFNNANDILVLIEVTDGRLDKIVAINTLGVAVLGYEKGEFLEMDPLLLVDESDREKIVELAKKSNELREVSFEILLRTKDGKKIPVETKSRVLSLGGKQLSLSVMRDITERKMAREIEKKAFFQIEDNIRQLATLGDSIRNPLAVIVGLADLHGGELGDKIKAEAAEIDDYITMLDRGWIESEKVRDFLKRHYDIK